MDSWFHLWPLFDCCWSKIRNPSEITIEKSIADNAWPMLIISGCWPGIICHVNRWPFFGLGQRYRTFSLFGFLSDSIQQTHGNLSFVLWGHADGIEEEPIRENSPVDISKICQRPKKEKVAAAGILSGDVSNALPMWTIFSCEILLENMSIMDMRVSSWEASAGPIFIDFFLPFGPAIRCFQKTWMNLTEISLADRHLFGRAVDISGKVLLILPNGCMKTERERDGSRW